MVVVRGAGDLATGIIVRLRAARFRVIALETESPLAIRRTVSLAEAVYDGEALVEGVRAVQVAGPEEAITAADSGLVPILVDPRAESVGIIRPDALVDAIMAKRNLGTSKSMAPIVVAVGPGFRAPEDAHAVVETNRGHYLGRVIVDGEAEEDTGTPGIIAGYGTERVVHAPCDGIVVEVRRIGDLVSRGDPVMEIRIESGISIAVPSPLDGTLRGAIRPGSRVRAGLKIADVDPRCVADHCRTVSDKARAVGGGVLEAILSQGGLPG